MKSTLHDFFDDSAARKDNLRVAYEKKHAKSTGDSEAMPQAEAMPQEAEAVEQRQR